MKKLICTAMGLVGSFVVSLFGGWSSALTTLCIFMLVDYATGLVVAGVFHASKKTNSGALESRAGFKGLCKKCTVLLLVLVGYRLDIAFGIAYIRDAICIAFITNELISIVENAGLMGVPIPKPITNAIDMLKAKTEKENINDD